MSAHCDLQTDESVDKRRKEEPKGRREMEIRREK
jgi:hypothetical protein